MFSIFGMWHHSGLHIADDRRHKLTFCSQTVSRSSHWSYFCHQPFIYKIVQSYLIVWHFRANKPTPYCDRHNLCIYPNIYPIFDLSCVVLLAHSFWVPYFDLVHSAVQFEIPFSILDSEMVDSQK